MALANPSPVAGLTEEEIEAEVAADESTALLGKSSLTGGTLSGDSKTGGRGDGLGDVSGVLGGAAGAEDDEDRPLPLAQIFLLCLARLIDPIAYFGIFPFINQMILETGGVEETDVGFYSGLIESLFSMTQMLVMILWGRAADRLGRKPVLVFSLCGAAVTTALFGVSRTIWQMILFRCFAGAFAGTVVTVRAMITENSTPKTQARAFSFFAFTGNLGILIGPLIGGALSNPATQYPSVFGKVAFFHNYPYALPTFVCGSISAIAAITSALFVKETLKTKDNTKSSSNEPTSIREIVRYPGVAQVLYIYGHVNLLGLAYTAIIPLFWFTKPVNGGFGFTPILISAFLAVTGISQAIWLLILFPPLQHRFGTGGVLRACAFFWPILFAISPFLNIVLKHHWTLAFWIIAPIALSLGSGVSMAFTGVQLALNDITPSSTTLGTLNALALTLTSAIRMVAPALFSSIFAAGVRSQFLNGYLVWVVLILLGVGLSVALRWLPAKAEGKLKHNGHAAPDDESN